MYRYAHSISVAPLCHSLCSSVMMSLTEIEPDVPGTPGGPGGPWAPKVPEPGVRVTTELD